MGVLDLEYGEDTALEKLLRSIDRQGDFCAHGRLFAPMPRLEVDGVGMLSFPVPEAQVHALIAAAEPAPYGKGPETLVDTKVRDCGANRCRADPSGRRRVARDVREDPRRRGLRSRLPGRSA